MQKFIISAAQALRSPVLTATGLSYNLNCYYDPKIGRYLQPDPTGDGLNPYTYVGGNPVNLVDPLGLCALRMVGGVADIAAGLAFTGVTNGWGSVAGN